MITGKNYVNGEFIPAEGDAFTSFNPSTEAPIGTFPHTSPQGVQNTVALAKEKFKGWRNISRVKRAEYFDKLAYAVKKHARKITTVISSETGKSLNESAAEVNEALHMAQYTFAQGREQTGRLVASEIAEKDVSIFRKPK